MFPGVLLEDVQLLDIATFKSTNDISLGKLIVRIYTLFDSLSSMKTLAPNCPSSPMSLLLSIRRRSPELDQDNKIVSAIFDVTGNWRIGVDAPCLLDVIFMWVVVSQSEEKSVSIL